MTLSSKPPKGPCRLQWGRDSSVAEMMRPDKVRPGRGAASMGPRLFSRGNLQWGQRRRSSRELQWGRDSSVAEISPPSCPRARWSSCFNGAATLQSRKCVRRDPTEFGKGMLQWGRDSSVAEMAATRPARSRRRRCFNGAATLQSRKSAAVEILRKVPSSFNGAATLQSRKWRRVPDCRRPSSRFNGAATLQSRKCRLLLAN